MPTVALLSPLPDPWGADARWDYPRRLAGALAEATGGRWRAELVGIGAAPSGGRQPSESSPTVRWEPKPETRRANAPRSGYEGRNLPAAFPPPRPENALSWALLDALPGWDILHLLTAFTRTADLGYVLGQLAGVPVVVTDLGPGGAIGSELELGQFAAAVVAPVPGAPPAGFAGAVTVIPPGPDAGAALAALYDRLLAGRGAA